MHEQITQQLSDYADGHLDADTRARVESHLAQCAECRDTLGRLREVTAWAPNYQGSAPARDLWKGVAARIEAERQPAAPPAWGRRRVSIQVPWLAAAALALVVSGGVIARMMQEPAPPVPVAMTPVRNWSPDLEQQTNTEYDEAIAELEAALASRDTALDPATLEVIRESLAAIDQAISEARQAIAEDSSNSYLNARIAQHMRRKLGILRKAAQAATAQS